MDSKEMEMTKVDWTLGYLSLFWGVITMAVRRVFCGKREPIPMYAGRPGWPQ